MQAAATMSGVAMPPPILEARQVTLRFRGVTALSDVSFAVREGELFSIIGPNGAGKTSIVNCISGRYRPAEGSIVYRAEDITQLKSNARPIPRAARALDLSCVISSAR